MPKVVTFSPAVVRVAFSPVDEFRSCIIRKCGSKYCLYSHKGKVLGRHDTYGEAAAQEKAIEISKARRGAAEWREEDHPRDGDGRFTDKDASTFFDVPQDFSLADARYDVSTQYPRDLMVVASVDLGELSSGYGNDYRVRQMSESIREGRAKFPPLTLELREPKKGTKTGTLNVLDGQTRIAAFRELGIHGRVPVVIRLYDYGAEKWLPKGVHIDEARTASLRKPRFAAEWDEAKHPRAPKGSDIGGQWVGAVDKPSVKIADALKELNKLPADDAEPNYDLYETEEEAEAAMDPDAVNIESLWKYTDIGFEGTEEEIALDVREAVGRLISQAQPITLSAADLAKLNSIQSTVTKSHVATLIKSYGKWASGANIAGESVVIFESAEGKRYLFDGYHRAVAARLLGVGLRVKLVKAPNVSIKGRKVSVRFGAYNPDQPRAPKGTDIGGQWVSTGAQLGPLYHGGKKKITDVDPLKLQSRDHGFYGEGFYVTSVRDYAKAYGNKVSEFKIDPDASVLMASLKPEDAPAGLVDEVFEDAKTQAWDRAVARGKTQALLDELELMRTDPLSWKQAVSAYAKRKDFAVVHFSSGEIVVRHHGKLKALAYNPDQPRAPKGDPGGGQWVPVAQSGMEFPFADDAILSGKDFDRAAGKELRQSHKLFRDIHEGYSSDATDDEDAQALKNSVSQDLAYALDDNFDEEQLSTLAELLGTAGAGESPGYDIGSAYVSLWAATSGDHNPLSVLYQHAVMEELGIEAETEHLLDGLSKDEVLKLVDSELGLSGGESHGFDSDFVYQTMKAHARAQYESTQAILRDAGVEHLTLARGLALDPEEANTIARNGHVSLQPLSSFTSDLDTAANFSLGSSGGDPEMDDVEGYNSASALSRGHIIRTRLPRSRIFSLPRTGFGCLSEFEFVVLGNRSTPVKIGKRYGKFNTKKGKTPPPSEPVADPNFVPFTAHREAEWNEAQHPRVPAGHPDGGQWTDGGSEYLPAVGPDPSKDFPFEDGKTGYDADGEFIDGEKELKDLQDEEESNFIESVYGGNGEPTAQQAKRTIEQTIGAHLESKLSRAELEEMANLLGIPSSIVRADPKDTARIDPTLDTTVIANAVASQIIHQWAMSSGDTHPWSVLIQDAIRQEFGLDDAMMSHMDEDPVKRAWSALFLDTQAERGTPQFAEDPDTLRQRSLITRALRAHVRAQYNETQLALERADIDSVDLVRGVALAGSSAEASREQAFEIGRTGIATLQPASSFSLSFNTARDFAHHSSALHITPTVIRARVPRRRILSFFKTGFGCLNEREIVVLGGKIKVRAMYWPA